MALIIAQSLKQTPFLPFVLEIDLLLTMTLNSATRSNAKSANKIPVRASKDSSVYDRLYKTTTASSKVRKEIAPVKAKNFLSRENEEPAPKRSSHKGNASRRVKKTVTKPVDGTVFNRLYQKGTASSSSKRSGADAENIQRNPLKPKNRV